MAGLDLGTLATYHRRELRHEMSKARVTGIDGQRAVDTSKDSSREGVLCSLRATIERCNLWLRGRRSPISRTSISR